MALGPNEEVIALRCLELFCGIGGFAEAADRLGWQVLRAIDIDQHAANVYRRNFGHEHQTRTIESLPIEELTAVGADLWWLSPPCQPFTRRGSQRGLNDPRSAAFCHLVRHLASARPARLALENVPEFAESNAAEWLRQTLKANGYQWYEQTWCATELGIPNRRRRYYLMASRLALRPRELRCQPLRPLREFLDDDADDTLVPSPALLAGYRSAIDCVDADEPHTVTSCFTSAYGKSPAQSGSYLRWNGQLRRFSPREILRLLGYRDDFILPEQLSLRQQWKLVGNSLSVPVVLHCLKHFR